MKPALLLLLLAACGGAGSAVQVDAGDAAVVHQVELQACPWAIVFLDRSQYLVAACRITAWEQNGSGTPFAHVECITDGGDPGCR